MRTRKSALAMAKQFRTCPPAMITRKTKDNMHYNNHLSLCPYCAAGNADNMADWHEIAEKIREVYQAADKETVSGFRRAKGMRAGQLRLIKPELARWQDGYFYSPPLVMVLDTHSEIEDDIFVAQTFHDSALAGPGDLILSRKKTGLCDMDLFVETWNIYTLKASFLGPALGKNLGADTIHEVFEMNRLPDYLPGWAPMPRPLIDDNDPRIYFRQLEIQVGSVFSIPAANALLNEFTQNRNDLFSIPDTIAAITELTPDAYWDDPPTTIEETLGLARFRRLSAADTDESEFLAKFAVFQHGTIRHFISLKAFIFKKKVVNGKLTLSGRIVMPPGTLPDSILIGFLDVPASPPLTAQRAEFDRETGAFYLEFDEPEGLHGKLELAVFINLSPAKGENG
jgi:hypothetical protein